MASLARSFAFPTCRGYSLVRRSLLPELSATRPRLFTASAPYCLSAKKQAPPPPKPKPKQNPKAASVGASSPSFAGPSRYAFIKSLASKPTPTLLYEAPSHFWFYFGCWSSGLSIIAWTALTGPSAVHQPEGVPQWVGLVFGASYVLLGSMGFFLISKTPNIVRTIRLLPPLPPSVGAASVSAGTSAAVFANPQVEVIVRRMLPFAQPKSITTSLDAVAIKTRFSLPSELVPELERLEMKRRQEALRKFDMAHLLTMPFRRLGRAFRDMFRGVRAAWTDMGYGIIRVDGKEYKVDVTKGFAHDGFRTLERIVSVGYK